MRKHLVVYLDHYRQLDIADCYLVPQKIVVSGNQSQDMNILFKNFKVAKTYRRNLSSRTVNLLHMLIDSTWAKPLLNLKA